jgi:hypothetical protein
LYTGDPKLRHPKYGKICDWFSNGPEIECSVHSYKISHYQPDFQKVKREMAGKGQQDLSGSFSDTAYFLDSQKF